MPDIARPERLRGAVSTERVRRRTAGEHETIVFHAEGEDLVLQGRNDSPFDDDDAVSLMVAPWRSEAIG